MTVDEKVAFYTPRGTLKRYVDFSNSAWFSENAPGNNYGILRNNPSTDVLPVQDNVITASGKSSMKMTIPSNSTGSVGSQFWVNYSPDLSVQYGENTEHWVQWQQRFGSFFATHRYSGGNGWKQIILGSGDQVGCLPSPYSQPPCFSSCSDIEVVVHNNLYRGIPQMYNSCTGCDAHGAFDGFDDFTHSNWSGLGPNFQNAYDDGSGQYCTYNPVNPGFGGNISHCFPYYANEWITFTVGIITGARSNNVFTSSIVHLYAARQNAQTAKHLISWGPYGLCAGAVGQNQKFGKAWLTPYDTNKDSSEVHQSDNTWYANLMIFSEQPSFITDETPQVVKRALVRR